MGLHTSRFLDFSPMAREVEERRRGRRMEGGEKLRVEGTKQEKEISISEESRIITRFVQNYQTLETKYLFRVRASR